MKSIYIYQYTNYILNMKNNFSRNDIFGCIMDPYFVMKCTYIIKKKKNLQNKMESNRNDCHLMDK